MSYTKYRASSVLGSLYHSFYDELNGTSQNNWVYKNALSLTDVFNGTYNPSWKSEIRAGNNAGTPASGSVYSLDPSWFSASWRSHRVQGYPYEVFESFEGYPQLPALFALDTNPPASLISSVRNRCIAKFLDQADAARSSFEAGQDIGEIRETIHSIISPMKTMRELTLGYLSNVKKLALKAKSRPTLHKAISDSFLEYKFGWNPLASDVAAGIVGLTHNDGHVNVQHISASAREFYPINPQFYGTIGSGNVIVTVIGQCTGEYQVRYRGGIRTGAVNGRIPLLQNLQLDMPHFIPTLWDLLPYSWMVDYFANIGECIRAASFQNANVSWGNVTTRRICHYTYSYDWRHDYDPTFLNVTMIKPSGNPTGTSTTFTRDIFVGSDLVPDFRFSIPVSEKPWENMAALLGGRIDSIRKSISQLRR
jgi:hypothetical protein